MKRLRNSKRQGGAALILFITVLVLGVAWYAIGALGKAPPTTAEREIKTGFALQATKQALIAHIVQYAARSNTAQPGQLPCPESVTLANPGEASTSCSNAIATVGRLPWKTLGIDQLRDGDGEPLWYVLSPGFRSPPINFANIGQLTYNGVANSAVALIIAPGRALNTLSAGTPPAGCANVNQQVATRNTASLDPANFLECGNAAGSYANLGTSQWTNDRVISVTAAEVMEAISGPIADRLQREVAPAMNDYRSATSLASWGQSFLPHASTWDSMGNSPPNSNLCGNIDVRAGMPPTATIAAGSCDTDWSSGSASNLGGLLNFGSCVSGANDMRCDFTVVLGGLATPRISATAPRIANSFRSFDPASIQISRNAGPWQSASVQNYSASISTTGPGAGNATIQFDVPLPLLSILETVVVRIPNPTDALLPDPRASWFLNNGWDRFTYYAVTPAATTNPGGTVCIPGGAVPDCLTVTGMPAPANDKRLVLALMGRAPIAPATWPSASPADYLEGANATPTDRTFEITTVTGSVNPFNDRLAACPFQYTPASGTALVICN